VNDTDENEPLASVDGETGASTSALPSHVAVIVDDAGNAEPETLTVDATAPLVGDRPIERVIAKLVAEVAELVPSDTATAYAPAGLAGTVNVVLTPPLPLLVAPDEIVAVVPPTVTVSDAFGANPVPVIVTDDATLPLVGLGAPTAAALVVTTIGSLSGDTALHEWYTAVTRYT
jgi:hypothetical protein